jgi:hypothetical protein
MRRLACVVLALLLVGCRLMARGQVSCDRIKVLQAQVGTETSLDQFRQWIRQTYSFVLGDSWVDSIREGEVHIVRWRKLEVDYTAVLEHLMIVDVAVSFPGGVISPEDVIGCLGQPERYRASYNSDIPGYALHLDLLFPDHGVLAGGATWLRSRPREPPPIDRGHPIQDLRFVLPGTAEQVLYEVYGAWADVYEQMLKEYKPWPEKWEDIVIEIDPSISQ